MRRGLISWSKAELPDTVLDARIARVQAAMAQGGIDILAIYTNPARESGVAWLAGFIPYWNQCVLLLPRDGRDRHLRVFPWSHAQETDGDQHLSVFGIQLIAGKLLRDEPIIGLIGGD